MPDDSGPLTLQQVVERRVGAGTAVSASEPSLALASVNVIASFPDLESARKAIRSVEGLAPSDEEIGFVTVGATTTSGRGDGVDPEGVAGYAASAARKGALIGGVLGAVVVGVIVAVVTGEMSAALAGAAGAAVLVGAIGAMIAAFGRLGGSEAYQDTFVTGDPQLCIVGLHLRSAADVERAADALQRAGGSEVLALDAAGAAIASADGRS